MTRANERRSVHSDRALFAWSSAVALLLRVPWLGAGYGWDSDAWREAAAAAAMSESGRFLSSRFPGNPLFEAASALVWSLGSWAQTPWALNGATALVAALGTGVFALLARRAGSAQPILAALAFTSVPAFFIVSTSTLDYAWGLSLGLLGLVLAWHGHGWGAGVALGLAIGARLTSALFLGPALLLLGAFHPTFSARTRSFAACLVAALALGAAWYVPLWREYGPAFLRFYDLGYPSIALVVKKATVDLWGWVGCAGIGAALFVGAFVRRREGRGGSAPPAPTRALRVACGLGLLLFLAAYLRLPYKPAYLLPAMPFALLLLASASPAAQRAFRIAAFGLLVSPWLLTVYEPGKTDDPAPSGIARSRTRETRIAGRRAIVDPRGPVLVDAARRHAGMAYGERVLAASRTVPRPAIVIAQDWLPQLRMRLRDYAGPVEEGGVRFVHQLTVADLDSARARGGGIYYLPGSETTHPVRLGLDPRKVGARPLPLSP